MTEERSQCMVERRCDVCVDASVMYITEKGVRVLAQTPNVKKEL